MNLKSPIIISLEREFSEDDEKAIKRLQAKWLIYDVKVNRKSRNAQIALFHSARATPYLLRELKTLYPKQYLNNI